MYFAEYLTIDINNIYTINSTRLSYVYMCCVYTVDGVCIVKEFVKFLLDSRTT